MEKIDYSAINGNIRISQTFNWLKKAPKNQSRIHFEIMKDMDIAKISITAFTKMIAKIAKQEFNVTPDIENKRKTEVNHATYACCNIIKEKYKSSVSTSRIGVVLAIAMNRKKPYDHATILHKLKKHNDLTDKRFGDKLYKEQFAKFKKKLRQLRLINESDKHI